jgi:ParB/RepB/Spo0J family partition protein
VSGRIAMAAAAPPAARKVPLAQIAPDPEQPRKSFEPREIEALAAEIRTAGRVHVPIILTPHPDPQARAETAYMVLDGEKRLRATRAAGFGEIDAILDEQQLSASDRLMLQLAVNDQRSNPPLLERALALRRALELSGLPDGEFAAQHQKSKAWISQHLAVTRTEGPLKELLELRLINHIDTALRFRKLPPDAQTRLLARARRSQIPVTKSLVLKVEEAHAQRQTREAEASAAEASGAASPPASPVAAFLEAGKPTPRTREAQTGGLEFLLTQRQLAFLLRRLGLEPHPDPRQASIQFHEFLEQEEDPL